jgi:hypothetical protein
VCIFEPKAPEFRSVIPSLLLIFCFTTEVFGQPPNPVFSSSYEVENIHGMFGEYRASRSDKRFFYRFWRQHLERLPFTETLPDGTVLHGTRMVDSKALSIAFGFDGVDYWLIDYSDCAMWRATERRDDHVWVIPRCVPVAFRCATPDLLEVAKSRAPAIRLHGRKTLKNFALLDVVCSELGTSNDKMFDLLSRSKDARQINVNEYLFTFGRDSKLVRYGPWQISIVVDNAETDGVKQTEFKFSKGIGSWVWQEFFPTNFMLKRVEPCDVKADEFSLSYYRSVLTTDESITVLVPGDR